MLADCAIVLKKWGLVPIFLDLVFGVHGVPETSLLKYFSYVEFFGSALVAKDGVSARCVSNEMGHIGKWGTTWGMSHRGPYRGPIGG